MAGEGRLITRATWAARLGGLATAACFAATTVMLTGCLVVQRAPDGSLSLTTGTPEQIAKREQAKADVPADAKDAVLHPDESTPAEVGTQFTTGSWQVSVTSVRPHSKMSDGAKPRKGNMLIYVNVKVKNVGAVTDLTVWPRQFWLTDSQNKRVKPFATDFAAFNAQQVRPVPIGMGAHTTFVYEIPKGSEGYDFHFRKRKTSPTIYSWQVW